MSGFKYVEDPILGKGRAEFNVGGGTGGTSYVGGTRIAIAGETISFVNSATIQNVTGTSVTLEPDTAYKITATASAVTLNANVPEAGKWAYEGHAEIFVAGTGYIVTGANVVLANPLEPDAVNNCVLRFHDGTCIIDVEDHVYGYVVTSISGTTQGTLPYGITSATQEYIAFDATTNGSTIDLSGSTASAEKHLVGNGYTSTTLTGAVDCGTSKFTVANLSLQDVQVTGGTMTLGDAFIPSGSTVAVSGGGLAVEKVTGNGGVIDLGGTSILHTSKTSATYGALTLMGGSAGTGLYGGGVCTYQSCHLTMSGTTVSGCVAMFGGGVFVNSFNQADLTGVVIANNTANSGGGISIFSSSVASLSNCILAGNTPNDVLINNGAVLALTGSNRLGLCQGSGSVTITSGAVLDLTGNTNATPIAPGGGIVFESGGATVLYGEVGSASSMFIDGLSMPNGVIKSGGVINFNQIGTDFYPPNSYRTVAITGGTLNCGSANNGSYMNYFSVSNLTLKELSLACVVYISVTGSNAGGTLTFGGIVKFVGSARIGATKANANQCGTCTLLTGTVLDVTDSTRTSTQGIIGGLDGADAHPVGTVVINSGVTIKDGETTVSLTEGTYHNAVILRNGTITEYPVE